MHPSFDRASPNHANISVMRPLRIFAFTLSLAACKFPLPPDVHDDGGGSATDAADPVDARPLSPMIAFTSDRTGNFDIFTTRIDGSDLTNLTNHPAFDGEPRWSPDGTRIAWVSDRTGAAELFVMNSDGTGLSTCQPVPSRASAGRPTAPC
jgi:hypothetical protein